MVVLVDGVVHHWHRVPAITRRMRDTLYTSLLGNSSKLIQIFFFVCLGFSILLILTSSALGRKDCWSLSQLLLGKGRMDELPVYCRETNNHSLQQKICSSEFASHACFGTVGGRQSTQSEPTQTCKLHTERSLGPGGEPVIFLLWVDSAIAHFWIVPQFYFCSLERPNIPN